MKKRTAVLPAILVLASHAQAATITFNDTVSSSWQDWSSSPIPYEESGFSLNSNNNGNIRYFEGSFEWVGLIGSANGSDMAAVVGGNTLDIVATDGGTFDAITIELGNVNPDSYVVTAYGYDDVTGGNLVASQAITLSAGAGFNGQASWQTYGFSSDLSGIKRLSLNFGPGNNYFVGIENITLNSGAAAVPEPASISLVGLGALAMLRRRRKA